MIAEEGVESTAKVLGKRFKYVSEESGRRYLYAVGEDVGDVSEKIEMKYGS